MKGVPEGRRRIQCSLRGFSALASVLSEGLQCSLRGFSVEGLWNPLHENIKFYEKGEEEERKALVWRA
jgi:hypothetical protein